MTSKFPQFHSSMLLPFIFMTFTFAPLIGFLYLHWAYIQHVMYMGVDDGMLVPPSDITQHEGYINVRDRVFVPPSDVYRMYSSSVGSLMPAGICATVGQHCLYVRHLVTTEDLMENAGSHMTTCGVSARTRHRRARTRRTEHQRTPKTSFPSRCGLFL
ncbi:hypothetical protein Taro_022558 [Colocasia esculenta]|uniref:Uncharacterized protein n=1 Tax=Colocasia esculenta TaxID=4460 RepID=A0A843V275_COLES|nr:hypothetical protein [Colocasia esculenta]